MAVDLDEVVKLAEQLEPEEQDRLIYRLRVRQLRQRNAEATPAPPAPPAEWMIHDDWYLKRGSEYVEYFRNPSRQELLEDVEALRRTAVQPGSGLMGKYANPDAPDLSDEELSAQLHAIATEWEQELDDFDDAQP